MMSLSKYSFGDQFIKGIRTILKNQESCVINDGRISTYFKKKTSKECLTGRSNLCISVYPCSQFFLMSKSNPCIKGLKLLSCKIEEETVLNFFQNCVKIKELWNNLREYFLCRVNFPFLSPQSAIFGFSEDDLKETV